MALTATATTQLQKQIIMLLGMVDPVIVEVCPDKPNLMYSIQPFDPDHTINDIVRELKDKRVQMDRTLIFCRRPLDCGVLYEKIRNKMGEDFTEPRGMPHRIPEVCLVDMYTGGTSKLVSDTIVKQFCIPDLCLRIVIATVAFGLGVDCPNVRKIMHFGMPTDIET